MAAIADRVYMQIKMSSAEAPFCCGMQNEFYLNNLDTFLDRQHMPKARKYFRFSGFGATSFPHSAPLSSNEKSI